MSGLPTWHTTAEVADALKVSVKYIRDLVADGVVNPVRLSKSPTAPMRFTDADVRALDAALRPATTEPLPERPRRKRRQRRKSAA